MSETKFTPGPWRIERCSCGHRSCNRMQPGPGMFYQGTGYDPADANLIAAAPELYEALALYVAACGNTAASVDRELVQLAWSKANAALRKARGETA